MKQDFVLHESVKEELSVQSYGSNLKESQQDPLAINYSDIENDREKYPCIVGIKEEILAEIQLEHEDIDLVEHKVESLVVNDNTVSNIYEDDIRASSSNETDTVSVRVQKDHKQIENYECNYCHKTYSTKQNVQMHIDSVHKGIKKYECKECHRMFSQAGSLNIHINSVHKRIVKHKCNECHKMFSQLGNLKTHVVSVHRRIKKVKRYIENNLKESEDSLTMNYSDIESVTKEYPCVVCIEEEILAEKLEEYKDIDIVEHKVEMPVVNDNTVTNIYEDGIPAKSTNRKDGVSLKVQKNNKQIEYYECNYCHKTYSTKNNLQTHIDSVHKGIKKYECQECSRMFSQVGSLKTHINGVHKRNKSYECNVCCKMFSRSDVLKRHINSVHKGIQKYQCAECHKMFSQLTQLKMHIFRMHKK